MSRTPQLPTPDRNLADTMRRVAILEALAPGNVKETFTNLSHTSAIAFGLAGFNWKHDGGALLLDLTDPLRPTPFADGVYSCTINCEAATSLTWDVGGYWVFQADIESDGITLLGKAQAMSPVTAPATPFPLSVTFADVFIAAGETIELVASNRDSHGHDFYMTHSWITKRG